MVKQQVHDMSVSDILNELLLAGAPHSEQDDFRLAELQYELARRNEPSRIAL